MVQTLIYLLIVIASIGIALVAVHSFREILDLEHKVLELKSQLERKRHTYPTNDGLEDALAVVAELMVREEMQSEYRQARLRSAKEILGLIREGPLAYDSDRPNNRPTAPG